MTTGSVKRKMSPAILDHSSSTKHHSRPPYSSNVYSNSSNEQQTFNFVAPPFTTMNNQREYKSAPPSSFRDEALLREFPNSFNAPPMNAENGRLKNPPKPCRDDFSSSGASIEGSLQPYLDEAVDKKANDTAAAVSNEEKGLCIKCGTQLYQIKTQKKGIFHSKTKEVKIPLSIPGQVERGHCLQCGVSSVPSTMDYADTAANINFRNGSISPALSHSVEDDKGIPNSSNATTSSSRNEHQSKASYKGSLNVYGERDGQGVMTWENGDVYTGEFFNGNRHGHGTLVFHDGTEYVGEWECNLQHGIGTRRWNNGDCYTGQYQNGKRTGEGRFYYSNGDMYIGQWASGVMHGCGRYYYASGQRFEGVFINGKRQGKGKLQRTDGSLDVGVYINDVRRGIGVRWSADRTLAWKMLDGTIKKKITIPEAVAMDYDIDAAAQDALNINTQPHVI